MANPIIDILQTNGKFDPKKITLLVFLIVVSSWVFSKLFGKTNYTVTKRRSSYGPENLEIVTTDNAIPSAPISKVPLKALGVLSQNNKRKYLAGFDVEGEDTLN